MINNMKAILKTEDGYSLVEVIASIILIAIILLSFFSLLTQSATTTKTSESIVNATYIAQTEMEILYSYKDKPDYEKTLEKLDYWSLGDGSYEKGNPPPNYYILLTLKPNVNGFANLTRIIIQVYDKEGGVLKAQMENTLEWGD